MTKDSWIKVMFVLAFVGIIIGAFALSGCDKIASIGGQGNYKEKTDYEALAKSKGWTRDGAVKVSKTIVLKDGETYDGGGKLHIWVGEHKDWCHASTEKSENVPSMFDMGKNSKIQNMHVECSLDGFTMNDNTEIRNVTFRDCEEDCINTKGENNRIINNKFYMAQDKSIQLNKAQGVLIQGNYFQDAGRALSGSGKESGGARGVVFLDNEMKNVEIGIRAQRNHEIYAKSNVIDGGRSMFEVVGDAVVYDCGGNKNEGGADRMSKKTEHETKDDDKKCKEALK